jgi:hypothetical protein
MKVVKYSRRHDFYYIASPSKVSEAILLSKENVVDFQKGNFKTIFPDLESDIVSSTSDEFDCENYSDYSNYEEVGCVAYVSTYDANEKGLKVSPGFYRLYSSDTGRTPVFNKARIENMDTYIELNNPASVLGDDILRFLDSEAKYEELKIRHRRGALVYGPPGNGKTLEIINIVKEITQTRDVVAFFVHDGKHINFDALLDYKECAEFKDRPVIFIFEEFTQLVGDGYTSEQVLNFLDGEHSWNNCYVIATTNFPQKIPSNVVGRPGRFDILIDVPNPNREVREVYLKSLLKGEVPAGLNDALHDMSIAYIREIVLRSKLTGVSPFEVLDAIKKSKVLISNAFCTVENGNYL